MSFLPSWREDFAQAIRERWKRVSTFVVLGHRLQQTGSIESCFDFVVRQAWKAFWKNVGQASCSRMSVRLRISMIERVVFPILNFRLSRWPFTLKYSRRLCTIQRKMVAVVLRVRILPGESPGCFVSRKQRAISREIPPFKSWSYIWASRVDTWALHIVRNTNNRVWAARIADFRNAEELEARRLANPSRRPDTLVLRQ